MNQKLYDVAKEVARKTPASTDQVLMEILRLSDMMARIGITTEEILEGITVESVEKVIMEKVIEG